MSEAIIETLSKNEYNVVFRFAGDEYVLVDYDIAYEKIDITQNLRVMAFDQELKNTIKDGIIETVPGFRASILIHYDPSKLPLSKLIQTLKTIELEMSESEVTSIPSRFIELPITFEDSKTREAIEWYTKYVRSDAPNVIDGHNIKYIAKYNGLESVDELIELITFTDWWVVTIGFWPGLPFMMPLDPRCMITSPKYNPTRPKTPEGAVGIGGPCVAIYPVESPGGYQLFGRTIPIFDIEQKNSAFKENPVLLKPGDRIKFTPVSEDKLDKIIERVHNNEYRYRITEYELFDLRRYQDFLEKIHDEAEEFKKKRDEASRRVPLP